MIKPINYAYVYPHDQQKCMRHRRSMRIFKGLSEDEGSMECECCARRVGLQTEVGQCCYPALDLAHLGPGLPLFFTFIRNVVILLFTLSFIFIAFALYSNIIVGDCNTKDVCSNNVFDTLSIINKFSQQSYLSIQNYTLLAFVVFCFFLFQCLRYSFRLVEEDCDDFINSPSDYAIILRRLPNETNTNDIQEMIEDRRRFLTEEEKEMTENLRVVSVVISYWMGQYTRVKQTNLENFQKCIDQQTTQTFIPQSLPELDTPASIAVVVFGRQQSKDFFKYKPNLLQKLLHCIWTPCLPRSDFTVRGEKVAVERAPEPDDIVWQNARISMCGAITRKTLYGILAVIILGAGGAAQYGLAVAEETYATTDREVLLMSTASSILVSILNAIIQVFLIFTSQKERNETKTEYNIVLMGKISLFQFLNAGIFVIIANFLANIDGFTLNDGLVFEVTQVMMINAIVPNLTLIFLNYFQLILKIKRYFLEKGTIKKSQLEANKLYEGPEAQIAYKYAYIFKTIWLTAFYAPLAPIVVPVSIVGLIFNYYVEKCLYGKSYSAPNMLSSMLNDAAIELLEYFPLILCLGEFLIYLYFKSFNFEELPEHWSIPIYISVGLSLINLLMPMDDLNHCLCKLPKDNMHLPPYEKAEEQFQVTYQMTNPAYICKRKRKRDKFIMKKLFGHLQNIEMTNLGLLGAANMKQPLISHSNSRPSPTNPMAFLNQNLDQKIVNQEYEKLKAIPFSPEENMLDAKRKNDLIYNSHLQQSQRFYSSTKGIKKELQLPQSQN